MCIFCLWHFLLVRASLFVVAEDATIGGLNALLRVRLLVIYGRAKTCHWTLREFSFPPLRSRAVVTEPQQHKCIEKSYCSNKDVIRPVADSIICKMSQGLPSMDSMRVAMRFSSTGFVYNLPSANTATAVGLGSSSAMIMAFVEAAWSSQVQEYRAGRCVKHSPSVRQPYGGRLFTSCGWCRYCYLCSFSCSYEPPTLGQKM